MTPNKISILVSCYLNVQLFIKTYNIEKKQVDLLHLRENRNPTRDKVRNKARYNT